LKVRHAHSEDVEELCELLNEIIRIGGTTAIEETLLPQEFRDRFLDGPRHVCCFVAQDEDGLLLGFQVLIRSDKLPEDCADIATFARQSPKRPGVGSAIFEKTRRHAAENGFARINATIRIDNRSGVAYYSKMGFADHAIDKGVPLRDGTPVDRVSKRLSLN